MSLKLLRLSLLSFAILFCPQILLAAPPAPDAQVTSTIDKVKSIVKTSPAGEATDAKLKSELFPMFDWDAMSRSSLGPKWASATPAEKKEFIDLFSGLLSNTYMSRIKAKVNESKVEVKDSKISGEKAAVKTVVTADGNPINVEYRLQSTGDKWQVYDVLIEGIGLISNYRQEFAEIVRKDGMQGLLQKLRDKQAGKPAA